MFREMARKKQLISEEKCIELLKKEPVFGQVLFEITQHFRFYS